MKTKYIYLILLVFLTGLNSCDKDFEQINTNPVLATSLDPMYLFSTAEYSSGVSTLNYQSALVQQILTPFTGVLEGDLRSTVGFSPLGKHMIAPEEKAFITSSSPMGIERPDNKSSLHSVGNPGIQNSGTEPGTDRGSESFLFTVEDG